MYQFGSSQIYWWVHAFFILPSGSGRVSYVCLKYRQAGIAVNLQGKWVGWCSFFQLTWILLCKHLFLILQNILCLNRNHKFTTLATLLLRTQGDNQLVSQSSPDKTNQDETISLFIILVLFLLEKSQPMRYFDTRLNDISKSLGPHSLGRSTCCHVRFHI